MKNLTKKLEIFANIAIVIVAVLLTVMIVQRIFFTNPPTTSKPESPSVGTELPLHDIDWSAQPKTVLLVLQKECRYCTQSAPFYQQLIQKVKSQNLKLIAVLPGNKDESEKYLNEIGLSGLDVYQSQLSSLKIKGTPTVLIINNKGEVSNVWIGKLSSDKEVEVINQL
ncbi:MAG TPA: thioredoxin-like domain-containing protein [Pyrinomonadaceae bacterium]|jgi:thioredoxin-related protein